IPIGGDVVGQIELAGIGAGLAPREEMPAVWRVLVDTGISVAVGKIQVAGERADGDVGGPVERLAGLKGGGRVGIPDGEEQLALGRELAAGVVEIIGEPQHALGVERDAVGAPDLSLAPGAEELAVAIEDDDGVLAAREAEDIVLRIHRHPGDLDVVPSGGQRAPAAYWFKTHGGSNRIHWPSSMAFSMRARRRRSGSSPSAWVMT